MRSIFKNKSFLVGLLRSLLITSLYLATPSLHAQSYGGCTVSINGSDTLTYTVSAGQIFCIDSTGQFEGNITLSGGTICNKGIFHPKVFSASSGTVMNHTCLRIDGDLTLPSGLSLVNGSQSTAALLGDLTISGGTLSNAGITNVDQDIIFSSGVLSNSAIVNCKTLTGAAIAGINNSGIISKD
jgi:hypothetical protein